MRPNPNNPARFGLVVVHAAFLAVVVLVQGCLSTSLPVVKDGEPDPYGFSVSVPATMPDRAGAFQLAAVADEYARQIEFDGKQETPVLGTTADVDERLSKMGRYAFEDKNPATPEFIEAVKAVMAKELEKDGSGQELTPELRAKSASIFKAVGQALRQVK